MLLAAGLTFIIVAGVFTLALCKAAGMADEKERQWVEHRKKEEHEVYNDRKRS